MTAKQIEIYRAVKTEIQEAANPRRVAATWEMLLLRSRPTADERRAVEQAIRDAGVRR